MQGINESINPCSTCMFEKCIISQVDDDPRDKTINGVSTTF